MTSYTFSLPLWAKMATVLCVAYGVCINTSFKWISTVVRATLFHFKIQVSMVWLHYGPWESPFSNKINFVSLIVLLRCHHCSVKLLLLLAHTHNYYFTGNTWSWWGHTGHQKYGYIFSKILCYSNKEHIDPRLILFFSSVCHLEGGYSASGTSVTLHVFTTCVGPILFVFRWCFTLSGLTYLSGKTFPGNRLIPQTALECFHRMAPRPSNTSLLQTL